MQGRDHSVLRPGKTPPLAPRLGTLGETFQTGLCQDSSSWLRKLQAGRGCRPGVRACGCVHERGHGATHTHTHTLTRPHPLKALGRVARVSPDLRPQASGFFWTTFPLQASRDPKRTGVAALGSPPAREGMGRRRPGLLPLGRRVRAGAPGPAPPRRQDRRGRGCRGGTGRAAPPRAARLRLARPNCNLTCGELSCPSSVVPAQRRVPCLPSKTPGKHSTVLRKGSPGLHCRIPRF